MARKKQEIQLQTVIETQEEWEEMLAKEGLTVVDVYQAWCGPCRPVVALFKQLRNEIGDPLLRFSVAKVDTIDSLEKYRGKCQPCFLCYGGGVLVAVIRGCNSPLLLKTVTEQLAYEHKVLDGQVERKEIRDTVVDVMVDKEKEDEEEEEEEVKKEVTVAVIRPDVVAEGRVEEVIEKMKASGLEILEHQERSLTEEEAREFYSHSKDEEYFEGLVKLMTSGPSHVLVITKGETGEGVIKQWRELLGPPSVETAKENAPDSFRAQFGKEGFANAIHGSDSHDTAMKELAFFFPSLALPSVPGKPKKSTTRIQRTLALIRPDAVKDEATRDALLAKIRDSGFEIAMQKEITITKEQAEDFYKEHKDEEYFDELTTRMCSGPLLALCLAREDAVSGWRGMLGPPKLSDAQAEQPKSLRAQFSVEGVEMNQIHGADSPETAEKEIDFFFPMQETLAVIKPDAYENRDEIMEKIKEAGFHIAARRETEINKDLVAQIYKDQQDKDYFGDLSEHMTSGPTLFMVLTGVDAVEGWRAKMGPTDPSQASEDTLRYKYGKDVKANALHGASSLTDARETIKAVFGDIEVDKKGEAATGDNEVVEQQQAAESGEEQQQQQQQQQQQGEGQETQETEQTQGEAGEAKETTEESKEEGGETQAEQAPEGQQEAASGETAPEEGAEEKPAEETKPDEAQQEAGGEAEQTEQPADTQQEEKADEGQTQEQTEGEATQESGGAAEQQQEEATQEESKAEETQQEATGEEQAPAAEGGEETQEKAEEPAATEAPAEGQTEQTEAQQEGEGQQEGETQQEAEGEKPAEEAAPATEEAAPAAEEAAPAAEEAAPAAEGTEQTEQGEAKEETPAAE